MICPNCGSTIKDAEKMCSICGFKLLISDETKTIVQNQENEIKENSEEELLKYYVGKNYDKISKGKFSWNSLLLGEIYFLYRKSWFISLIYFIVQLLLVVSFASIYGIVIIDLILVVLSLMYNKLYINIAKKKVRKIIIKNKDKTSEQLISICSKKGGTSVVAAILLSIIYIAIVYRFTFLFIRKAIIYDIDKLIITDEMVEPRDLKYSIPEGFVKDESTSTENQFIFSYSSSTDACFLGIEKETNTNGFLDSKEVLNQLVINYSSVYSNEDGTYKFITKDIDINNYKWYVLYMEDQTYSFYKYVILYGRDYYIVDFHVTKDSTEFCTVAHNELVNSLKFE